MIRHKNYILFFISLSFFTVKTFSADTSCSALLKNKESFSSYEHKKLSKISLLQLSKLKSQKTLKNRVKKFTGRESRSFIEEEFDNFLLNPQIYIWNEMRADLNQGLELEYLLSLFLRFGKIVKKKMLPMGDNLPELITLENGLQAILKWRNKSNSGKEVAAYIIDRELGFNLVPLTVQRPHQGFMASVQIKVLDLDTSTSEIPNEIKLFNFMINKNDIHDGNRLRTINGSNISIDHDSETFKVHSVPLLKLLRHEKIKMTTIRHKTSSTKNTERYDNFSELQNHFDPISEKKLDESKNLYHAIHSRPDVIKKLRILEPQHWHNVLSPYLSEKEVDAFLNRRLEILSFFSLI